MEVGISNRVGFIKPIFVRIQTANPGATECRSIRSLGTDAVQKRIGS